MAVLTEINSNQVKVIFEGTFQLCEEKRRYLRKTNPRTRYEVRSSKEAVKAKPILKP
jgi:hypothetical protein